MTTDSKQELLEGLAEYGYPLMEPRHNNQPETVLGQLLRQQESRLLEGFAVVLLSGLRRKANLRWELSKWKPEKELGPAGEQRLARLLCVSFLLFRLFAVEKNLQERVLGLLKKCEGGEQLFSEVEEAFAKNSSVAVDGLMLSTERLKNTFRLYYVATDEKQKEDEMARALEFELLLAELFTPRQKELIRKKLAHAQMTNSEKAYFYRAVRKRLKAVADEDVHSLARRLVAR